jgi:hypothetical protein
MKNSIIDGRRCDFWGIEMLDDDFEVLIKL